MLNYDLGEMKTKNGLALWHQIDETCVQYAYRILDSVKAQPVYKELMERLPSERVQLYFLRAIKSEIYPFVLRGHIIQWYVRQKLPIDHKNRVVYVRGIGIFKQLERIWDIETVPIKSVHPFSPYILHDELLRSIFIRTTRAHIKKAFIKKCCSTDRADLLVKPLVGAKIACHYIEGLDVTRRSDLHWFANSDVRPEQVVMYFDDLSIVHTGGKPIDRRVIEHIEKKGFQWVSLLNGVVDGEDGHLWMPPPLPDGWLMKGGEDTLMGQWIIDNGNKLLRDTHYWRSFHNRFGVRIHCITEEGFARNIAQAVAFDIDRENGGLLAGRQRSELFLSSDHMAGYHPKHLFFVWNRRAEKYLKPNYNHIEQLFITGYQNNVFQRFEGMDKAIRKNGAKFVIVMFDSGHRRDVAFSTKAMSKYYDTFLQLVIADPEIGLVIKPKKQMFFNLLLPETRNLFDAAMATGRCVKMEGSFGRLPSEASVGADMAIGIGSPTAVIEAVIAGQRGIFYDISLMKDHEFYEWGYERVVFDNLENIISALKRYKENPVDNASLGDWSTHMDELDPFRDGKGGARIGMYMSWLLESFNRGENRDRAVEYANRLYRDKWGEDKVVDMELRSGAVSNGRQKRLWH